MWRTGGLHGTLMFNWRAKATMPWSAAVAQSSVSSIRGPSKRHLSLTPYPTPRTGDGRLSLNAWRSHRTEFGERFCVVQVGINRCDHDTCFNGNQVDADERYADPCIDDDTLVQHVVKHVNDAG